MPELGQRFRQYSWLLLGCSASLMTYSGLFFLGFLPFPPIPRFWDGGMTARFIAGTLDMFSGLAVFGVVGLLVTRGSLRSSPTLTRLNVYLRILAFFYGLGLVGDLIGGLYGIGAQIGLYTTFIVWWTIRSL